jgi:Skp family chaperone for outer membrane proteins
MKTCVAVVLSGLLISSTAFSQSDDDIKFIQAENTLLKATVKSQKAELADLKAKLAKAEEPLRAKNAELSKQLVDLRSKSEEESAKAKAESEEESAKAKAEIEQLQTRIKALDGVVATLKRKPENREKLIVPLTGDETPLTKAETSPRDYLGKTFIVVGAISTQDYYNFGYRDGKDTYVSFLLRELRQDGTQTQKNAHLYLRRGKAATALVDAVTAVVTNGKEAKLIRVKVTIDPARYEEGNSKMFELLDYQFLNPDDKTSWGDWQSGESSKPAKPTKSN